MKNVTKFYNRFWAWMLIAAIVMTGLAVNSAIRYNETRAELAALTAELENLKSGLKSEQDIDVVKDYIDNVTIPVKIPPKSDRIIYVPDRISDQ